MHNLYSHVHVLLQILNHIFKHAYLVNDHFVHYIPNTHCHLPDGGGILCLKEPQLKCPMCDEDSYGSFMNIDLFPELKFEV